MERSLSSLTCSPPIPRLAPRRVARSSPPYERQTYGPFVVSCGTQQSERLVVAVTRPGTASRDGCGLL